MTAHRCRICRLPHYDPERAISYPTPEVLAALAPFLLPLIEAAREFEACAEQEGVDIGTPVEFVQWLSFDATRAAETAVKLAARA